MTLDLPLPLSLCFDLDGTLVDTAPDLIRVLNLVIAEDGLSETDYEKARKDVGYGSRKLIEEAFFRADTTVTAGRVDHLQKLFLDLYAEDIAQKSQPFPGVIDTLCQLRAAGAELSVCTNKPGYLARPLLDALKMTELFVRIVGSEDVLNKKPDAGHIFAAAGHRGVTKLGDVCKIVMVGDSLPDILAAKNARVPSIAVSFGYSSTPVEQLGADCVIRNFRDIVPALKNVLAS